MVYLVDRPYLQGSLALVIQGNSFFHSGLNLMRYIAAPGLGRFRAQVALALALVALLFFLACAKSEAHMTESESPSTSKDIVYSQGPSRHLHDRNQHTLTHYAAYSSCGHFIKISKLSAYTLTRTLTRLE